MKRKNPPAGPADSERFYLVAEVAAQRRVKPRTVHNWIKYRGLRVTRKGRLIRISQSALNDFDKAIDYQ